MKKYSFIYAILLINLFGCSSHKTMTDLVQTHISDTAQQSTASVAEVRKKELDIDSIFNTWMQRIHTQIENKDAEMEHISETITSYTDSLGNTVRNEKRTTDRTLSHHTTMQRQQWEDEQEKSVRIQNREIDSLLAAMESRLKCHWQDSTKFNQAKEKQEKTVFPLKTICLFFILIIILRLLFFLSKRLRKEKC